MLQLTAPTTTITSTTTTATTTTTTATSLSSNKRKQTRNNNKILKDNKTNNKQTRTINRMQIKMSLQQRIIMPISDLISSTNYHKHYHHNVRCRCRCCCCSCCISSSSSCIDINVQKKKQTQKHKHKHKQTKASLLLFIHSLAVFCLLISTKNQAIATTTAPKLAINNMMDDVTTQQTNNNKHTMHTLMSRDDLRRTFQVDSHDLVPEYQVLQLIEDGSHVIVSATSVDPGAKPLMAKQASNYGPRSDVNNNDKDNDNPSELHSNEPNNKPLRLTKRNVQDEIEKNINTNIHRQHDVHKSNTPIVIKLNTFGKDIKLRLKRNSDFQKRVKNMKVFLAESTLDGKLRYTEIAANAPMAQASSQQLLNNTSTQSMLRNSTTKQTDHDHNRNHKHQSSIGSTFHDEINLAAMLIDRDATTGRLLVDGTIGNDFVIRPLPASATSAASSLFSSPTQAASVAADTNLQQLASEGSNFNLNFNSKATRRQAPNQTGDSPAQAAHLGAVKPIGSHLHDDDPHDDDEMFLDEDEALELAAAKNAATSSQSADAANNSIPSLPTASQLATSLPQAVVDAGQQPLSSQRQDEQQQQYQPLSKAAAGRKWRKYRKLIASGAAQPQPQPQPQPQSLSRNRRNLPESSDSRPLRVSHHVVYRMSAAEVANAHLGDTDDLFGGQFLLEPGLAMQNNSRSPPGRVQTVSSAWSLFNDDSLANLTDTLTLKQRVKRSLGNGMSLQQQQQQHLTNRRTKRQAPETVWPEVLLVVDYDSFLLHGGDSREVKKYFVSFWNGVDLRYKLLVHPHIRISLAGMIVAKDREATPYLERNRLRAPNADAVDAAGALTDMGKYLYREDRLPTYDLAVVITKLDMCRRRYEGGRCNRGTAGFAYVGGACVVNKRLEKVNSVAIIEDSGGFSGIIVAAHEVGHLLGCVHDGSPPPGYLGGPGATHCPWEDGFIMSDLRHTERGFKWSQCSVEQFKHFLNGETATCLYNYPHENQMLQRYLPGTMLSLDEQCKRDRGTNACFKDARVCAQLFCFDSASGYCVSYRPAAEGSPCGEAQVCRNGKCVGEIENIIPDYTQVSQAFVARRPDGLPIGGRHISMAASAASPATATTPKSAKLVGINSRMDSYPIETPLISSNNMRRSGLPFVPSNTADLNPNQHNNKNYLNVMMYNSNNDNNNNNNNNNNNHNHNHNHRNNNNNNNRRQNMQQQSQRHINQGHNNNNRLNKHQRHQIY